MKQALRKWLIATAASWLIFPAAADAGGLSIRTIGAQERRLATIGYRIASANVGYCSDPAMMSGLVVHDLGQYPLPARASVSSAFSLRNGIGILEIVPGSGADRAGLRVDDEVLSVGGRSMEDSRVWHERKASYRRIDDFLGFMSRSLEVGPQQVVVRRGGRILRLTLSGQPGCGGDVKLVDSSRVSAWSDGRHVVLSIGLVRMASSDDEIAFVIAHEMAHNILKHSRPGSRTSRPSFGRLFGSRGPRGSESQADVAAVSLMTHAGYVPQASLTFLRTASWRMGWSLSLTHPGFGSRMRTVAAAIDRDRLHQRTAYPVASLVVAENKEQPRLLAVGPSPAMKIGQPRATSERAAKSLSLKSAAGS